MAPGILRRIGCVKYSYLDEAIGVGGNEGEIARLGVGVVLGRVLLHRELEDFFLRVSRCPGVLSNMLSVDDMLLNLKCGRHLSRSSPEALRRYNAQGRGCRGITEYNTKNRPRGRCEEMRLMPSPDEADSQTNTEAIRKRSGYWTDIYARILR